jgi:hypothetical protein
MTLLKDVPIGRPFKRNGCQCVYRRVGLVVIPTRVGSLGHCRVEPIHVCDLHRVEAESRDNWDWYTEYPVDYDPFTDALVESFQE